MTSEVQAALVGESSPLSRVFRLVLAYERADWAKVGSLAGELGIDEAIIPDVCLQAATWANDLTVRPKALS